MSRHGRVDSVHSYYSHRPRFDPERRHLPAHRARRMLNMHLDSLGKNHTLSTSCLTFGNNVNSERSAAHDCIDGKDRRLDVVLAKRYGRRDTRVCIPTSVYTWSRMAKQTEVSAAAPRLLAHAPFHFPIAHKRYGAMQCFARASVPVGRLK